MKDILVNCLLGAGIILLIISGAMFLYAIFQSLMYAIIFSVFAICSYYVGKYINDRY